MQQQFFTNPATFTPPSSTSTDVFMGMGATEVTEGSGLEPHRLVLPSAVATVSSS
jgi:hypothetical protein